ncbi:amidase [Cognatiyoonia sp. IB215182]|uniref:amidase n=1 Tax=Cognatiyoonia sp. IB215182 TaxID=3097353 RepID=UPI002A0B434E|nr:amidase [Cognatiyoonia sp. IB215182]MDX8353336.1 amidase [Cognatiyoonia sp. IB215182]
MADFLEWEAHRLSAAIAAGIVGAADLMQATLDRIAERNPAFNAIVALRDPATLMEESRQADMVPAKGPLHGIPMAVKDLANVGGLPTSMGSPVFAGQIAATSDPMVQRMQDAGAIIIGKTNTPEFGLGSHTYNPVFGATQNAMMPGCSAGGSSGGAAVALATGMLCLADGSDMMGSLRNPAGWNGVYGMRPSWGRVPAAPVGDMFLHPLSTNGPMARCPRDIALLLEVQAGPEPDQPFGLAAETFQDDLTSDVTGRRIAWLRDWGGAYPMEDGVLEACEPGIARLARMGCIVEEVAPPFDAAALWEAWITLRAWAVAAKLGPLYAQQKMRPQLKPAAIWEVERGLALTGAQIQKASAIRSDWFRAASGLFANYDAFVLPTAQCFPFPIDWEWPKEIGGVPMNTYHQWMAITIPVSLIGLPCLAVPVPGERPIGLQIAGRPRDDKGVLQLGEAWHGID